MKNMIVIGYPWAGTLPIVGIRSLKSGNSFLLLKGKPDQIHKPGPAYVTGNRQGRRRIRCSRCDWEPSQHHRWECICSHTWNTFETGGVCPACGRKWTETQCLKCHEWSRHEDWYVDEPGTST